MNVTVSHAARRTAQILSAVLLAAGTAAAGAQMSLQTAVDLALTHSPRIKMAGDDIARARASISEVKAAYIPPVNLGGGYGDSFGYSNNLPTFFAFQTQSLVFNYSQLDYLRAAHSGFDAATFSLREARTGVIEETVLAYITLQRDQRRAAALQTQDGYAQRLVAIVQDRFDAGLESRIDLHTAKLTNAQVHLRVVSAQNDLANDRATLALLTGLLPKELTVSDSIPEVRLSDVDFVVAPESPGILAAFANAKAKQQTAWGDARYLYRPQISFIFQYNRYATFTDSFKQIEKAYGQQIGKDQYDFALIFNLPVFDKSHQAKARESAADAAHAFHEAQTQQLVFNEGQSKLSNSLDLLRARADVATQERALAEDQLEVVRAQLEAPATGNAPQLTPKDEQNARIAEREKFLNVVDSDSAVLQAQIRLLRQTGRLEDWVKNPVPVSAGRPALPLPELQPVLP